MYLAMKSKNVHNLANKVNHPSPPEEIKKMLKKRLSGEYQIYRHVLKNLEKEYILLNKDQDHWIIIYEYYRCDMLKIIIK